MRERDAEAARTVEAARERAGLGVLSDSSNVSSSSDSPTVVID